MEHLIYGKGGGGDDGGSSRSAVEYPDTLSSKSYVKAIDLLGEGEFEEVLVGGLTGMLLDDIPVQNKDGTYNFTGINIETRPGTLGQSRMNIGDTTESTESIGTELRYGLPIEYAVAAEETDVVRVNVKVPALTQTNTKNGDITGTSVSYKIEWKDSVSSSWNTVIDGTYVTVNKSLVSANNGIASFSGYSFYNYVINLNSHVYTSGELFYQGQAGYILQKRVNNGSWITISSSYLVENKTISGSISAETTDVVELRVVFTSEENVPIEYTLYSSNTYDISVSANYTYATGVQTISGKSSSEYERQTSFRIDGTAPWIIRVTRLTADSTSSYLQNKTYLASITTVLEERLRYPGSVLVGGVYDAEQFSAIPSRAFLCKCLKVKIPTNYDPITREYTGVWDGSFKVAWTDNPAWCFYDLLTNTRYGLGERIPESYVDKAELYSIAQYCDELVPGYGGVMEPRFTCNVVIQTREEAYKVISDFASIFRGMTYWASGAITPVQDRPQTVSYAFNNANVVDGIFNYQSSTLQSRYNAVTVTWNNPANYYKREVEYVEDADLIASLGHVNSTSIVAFGCTSRGMARRVGRWLIYTNNYQTDTVTFTTGMEGSVPRPGDVIKINDSLRATERRGGRVVSATLSGVVLDKSMEFVSGTTYTFSGINTDGNLVETTFTASGTTDSITFTTDLPSALAQDSIYIIADDDIEPETFKVISVTDKGESRYEVSAISYNASKYAYIEQNVPLTTTKLPIATIYPVTAIDYIEYLYTDGVSIKNRCDISWKAPKFAKTYIVNIRKPDGTIINESVSYTSYNLLDAVEGTYSISVTAVNILGQQATVYNKDITLYGKFVAPVDVTGLEVVSASGMAYLTWDSHPDLDVVVGGWIYITHTPKTTGATWADGLFVTKVPGSSISTFVPLRAGTYMAKAIDSSEVYSVNAAFASAEYALLQEKNIVETLEEHPTFVGDKTNMYVADTALMLEPIRLIDDTMDLMDTWSSFDYLGGGVYTSGEYEFSRHVDLGSSYRVNLEGSLSARSVELAGLFDERTTLMSDWGAFDSLLPDSYTCKVMIATTEDDPDGTPVWSEWTELKVAAYSARGFKFKLVVTTDSELYGVAIDELAVSIDVDDRTVGDNDLTCTTSGLNITFSPAFMFTPAVSVAINDMVEGDYYEITSKSANGFSFIVKNNGTAVERVIDYIAKGYGYETA